MFKKSKYYSLKKILERNAYYNIIIGERSNGKTYACLLYGLTDYVKNGNQLAIIRRWNDDIKTKRASTFFDAIVSNNEVTKLTNGEWSIIHYRMGKWYLARYDDKDKLEIAEEPFAYAFAISTMEHDKSASYPKIKNVLFDEFITRSYYLPDEFILFMNTLSTIIRDKNDVKIFMCGNTVSKACPYFSEMGLTHIKDMQPGSIDLYTYGDTNLSVAVEFCKPNAEGKASDVYFSFDNPRLNMITGSGNVWEIAIYPHLPIKYDQKDILFTYFIIYDGIKLQCEIIKRDDLLFTFIHLKTSDLKNPDKDLIYCPDIVAKLNWSRNILRPKNKTEQRIAWFFNNDKVFYQDNETGEIVRNYLMFCKKA